MSLPVLALYGGSVPNYGCPPIRGRVPGLPIVLPGWGDPCGNFLRSGAVVFWVFWVRCGRVKLVSSSLGSTWGVIGELRMPTHKGEGTSLSSSLGSIWGVSAELRMPTSTGVPGLPIVLPGWGDPCTNFSGSGAVVFWGFWVRCGRVKLVSSSLGSTWVVSAELRMPTYKRVPGLPIVLPG